MTRLAAIERQLNRSPVLGPSAAEIDAALVEVCSDAQHSDHAAALEFRALVAAALPGLGAGKALDPAPFSDIALDFSIRLLEGALRSQAEPH